MDQDDNGAQRPNNSSGLMQAVKTSQEENGLLLIRKARELPAFPEREVGLNSIPLGTCLSALHLVP